MAHAWIGDVDLHLFNEGRHRRLWDVLGSHERTVGGLEGVTFAVWAPTARAVRVVGDWNSWDGRVHPMAPVGASGIWATFVPGIKTGAVYKYEVDGADGRIRLKADPLARFAEVPPAQASVVFESAYTWRDDAWLEHRASEDLVNRPMRIFEVHLGSWRPGLSYREAAAQLTDYVVDLGFTHVELLPLAQHPFAGSWGYQVSGYFAPDSRHGTPDDLRFMIDSLHERGVGVIMDWVPAHFPKDDWALARFDGTALYEHADPRLGEHPDWGTLVFNFGRFEVREFLIANALYWFEEFHVDGLRVDAVASMLYLDYSRANGQWVPNRYGGRENLDAIEFLREANAAVFGAHAGAMMIAEESTAWPSVSRPVDHGGLGFTHKWNMGWMHDTLDYAKHDPVHRRYHHRDLTFGLLYAFTENFVLPFSHDEVVHGKGSLARKMPGDEWQRFANLRALYGWMWAHPGKKLLFMGSEIGQWGEWDADAGVDWLALEGEYHRGVQELVRAVNRGHEEWPALWERDFEAPGFQWTEADDAARSTYAFLRWARDGSQAVACIANFTPVPLEEYRVGLPWGGAWRVALDTNSTFFGGTGYGGTDWVSADGGVPHHGQPASAVMTLPPLAVVWLASHRPQ